MSASLKAWLLFSGESVGFWIRSERFHAGMDTEQSLFKRPLVSISMGAIEPHFPISVIWFFLNALTQQHFNKDRVMWSQGNRESRVYENVMKSCMQSYKVRAVHGCMLRHRNRILLAALLCSCGTSHFWERWLPFLLFSWCVPLWKWSAYIYTAYPQVFSKVFLYMSRSS